MGKVPLARALSCRPLAGRGAPFSSGAGLRVDAASADALSILPPRGTAGDGPVLLMERRIEGQVIGLTGLEIWIKV